MKHRSLKNPAYFDLCDRFGGSAVFRIRLIICRNISDRFIIRADHVVGISVMLTEMILMKCFMHADLSDPKQTGLPECRLQIIILERMISKMPGKDHNSAVKFN